MIDPTVSGPRVTADLSAADLARENPTGGSLRWRIGYRIVSADGHPVAGIMEFSVGTGQAAPFADAVGTGGTALPVAENTPADATTNRSWVWVSGAVIAVVVASGGLALGLRARRRHPPGVEQSADW